MQALDRGFRTKPPPFSPEQERTYRSHAHYRRGIDDTAHQQATTQPTRFISSQRAPRTRKPPLTGPYISPAAQLHNPRAPLWKRDYPNASGFLQACIRLSGGGGNRPTCACVQSRKPL